MKILFAPDYHEGQPYQECLSDDGLSNEELKTWLCAVDCCLFNYREIFCPGAASLARSFGIPLLIPERLQTAFLDEPHARLECFDLSAPQSSH